jgi:hypothetical protein
MNRVMSNLSGLSLVHHLALRPDKNWMCLVTKLSYRGVVCNLRFCPFRLSSVGEIYLYNPHRSINRDDNLRGGLQSEQG